MIFAVTEQHDRLPAALDLAFGAPEQAQGGTQRWPQRGPRHRHGIDVHRFQKQPHRAVVHGQRAVRVGLACESHQRHAIAGEQIEQGADGVLGLLEPAGRQILARHAQ